jgi:hypothetical protein
MGLSVATESGIQSPTKRSVIPTFFHASEAGGSENLHKRAKDLRSELKETGRISESWRKSAQEVGVMGQSSVGVVALASGDPWHSDSMQMTVDERLRSGTMKQGSTGRKTGSRWNRSRTFCGQLSLSED